ncbi:MAG: DUF924 domain-containing protein, partial [Myxococcales bacterium]|nr:DUF924 domain-containing protein [Myxococcales bacterium]
GETALSEGGASDPAAADKWFKKDPDFDEQIRQTFTSDIDRATRGEYDGWPAEPPPEKGALALVVLCDQLPRNVFRENARAFALDPRALGVTERGLASGLDKKLSLLERYVFAMPLMHAEDREVQQKSLRTFAELVRDATATPIETLAVAALDYAERHAKIVERFGRYPHRNNLLGRASSEEEIAFLKEPGSSF